MDFKWARGRLQGRQQGTELVSGKGASIQLQTPLTVRQPYLGSSQGHRRTRTPPSHTQGNGHLGRKEQRGRLYLSLQWHPDSHPKYASRPVAGSGYPITGQHMSAPKSTPRQPLCIGNRGSDTATSPQAAPTPCGWRVPCSIRGGCPHVPTMGAASEGWEEGVRRYWGGYL